MEGDANGALPLVRAWFPALESADRRLRRGGRVAEIGAASSSAVIAIARAYPEATFHGFDPDPSTVAAVRDVIAAAGLSDRVTYEVLRAYDVPGPGYDLIRGQVERGIGPPFRRSALRSGGVWIGYDAYRSTVTVRTALVPRW